MYLFVFHLRAVRPAWPGTATVQATVGSGLAVSRSRPPPPAARRARTPAAGYPRPTKSAAAPHSCPTASAPDPCHPCTVRTGHPYLKQDTDTRELLYHND